MTMLKYEKLGWLQSLAFLTGHILIRQTSFPSIEYEKALRSGWNFWVSGHANDHN
jgi:hypothetical protein